MIYNVVINSTNYVGGTNGSNLEYNFDWSNFEEGEYEMSFAYNAVLSTLTSTLIVSVDLGVCMNSFTTTSSTSQRFSNVIGAIAPTITADGNYTYNASSVFNPPVYLKSRPMSNRITIFTRDLNGALTDVGVDYVLILSFKKL